MGKILFMRKGEIHTAPIVYIDSISIKNAPNKTSYTVGQSFDPTGMVVEALYKDGRIVEITGYTIVNGNSLSLGQTSVTISYTENGITKTATQAITVVKSLGSLAIGDIVYLKENGTPVEYLVVNQGKPSSMYDASCNGTWLLRKTIKETREWASPEYNSYKDSSIHNRLNNTLLNEYDDNIRNQIKTVKIPYVNGTGTNGTVSSGSNGLSTKVFLLSGYEAGYTTSTYSDLPKDGACLSYFNGKSYSEHIAFLSNGNRYEWWLRSTHMTGDYHSYGVTKDGYAGFYWTTGSYGIRPALVMPSDTAVNDDNSIG